MLGIIPELDDITLVALRANVPERPRILHLTNSRSDIRENFAAKRTSGYEERRPARVN